MGIQINASEDVLNVTAKETSQQVNTSNAHTERTVAAGSWNNLSDRPFGSETSAKITLFEKSVAFSGNVYEITQRLPGPLIIGDLYTLTVRPALSFNTQTYSNRTALGRYIGSKLYYVVGNNSLVPNMSTTEDTGEKIAVVIDPDNKPNDKGVYGWIFTNESFEGNANITMVGKYEIITKMPKKYLPDDIAISGGGVSSWNDLTDKPFGEVEKEGYIIPETTLALSGGDGYLFEQPAALWANGQSYNVNWNGTDYNCIAAELDVTGEGNIGYLLGNMAAMGGDDTGEPFLIVGLNSSVDGAWGLAYDFAGAETATFSVYGLGVFTEKIEEKYISNNARTFTVNFSVDNGKMIADKTHAEIMQALCLGMNIRCLFASKVFTEFVCDETHVEFIGTEVSSNTLRRQRVTLESNGSVTYSADVVSLGLRSRDGYHCNVNDEGLPIEFNGQTQAEAYSNITNCIAEGNPVYLLKFIGGSEIGSFIHMTDDGSLVFMRIEPTSDGTEMQMVFTFVRKPQSGYDNMFDTYKTTLSATAQ